MPQPWLQCCLNGARSPGEHPALPCTPDDLAREAAAAVAAGARAVHLHGKDERGRDSLLDSHVAAAVTAVRAAVPGVEVGATTGAWAVPVPEDRVAAVSRWRTAPDVASVNWHEPGAEAVAAALLDAGIDVEAGLWHAQAVAAWARSSLRHRCLRVLVELPDGLDEEGSAGLGRELVERVVASGFPRQRVLLHGEGSSCWPALRLAGRLGLSTRIGLEDTLTLPDGRPAEGNAQLVRAAQRELLGRAAP